TGQHHIISHGDVPRQCTVIRENTIVPHDTIVRDMAVGLYQAVISDHRFPTVLCAPVNGYTFPDSGVVTYFRRCLLSGKLQVLRDARDHGPRENPAVFADPGTIHDSHIGADPRPLVDHHIFMDGYKGLYHHIICNTCLGMYISKGLYHSLVSDSLTFTI